jgi:hypothetical protein
MSETKGKGSAATQFRPGQSGNPAGRPKGARSKLSETFLGDLLAAYNEKKGGDVLKDLFDSNPLEMVKQIAGLLPKEVGLEVTERQPFAVIPEVIEDAEEWRARFAPTADDEPTKGQ